MVQTAAQTHCAKLIRWKIPNYLPYSKAVRVPIVWLRDITEPFMQPDTDELVPDPKVWRELGISSMTGWRWTRDHQLGFPPPIKIKARNYRSRRALNEWRERMI